MSKSIKVVITLLSLIAVLSLTTSVFGQEQVKDTFTAEFGGPAINYGQITTATVFIVVIIIIALLLIKKTHLTNIPNQGLLEVVYNYSVSSKEKLLVVRAGSEYLLLSSSASGIRKIHIMNKEDIGACMSEKNMHKNEFANIFINMMGKK